MNEHVKLTYNMNGYGTAREFATDKLVERLYAVGALDVRVNREDKDKWVVEATIPLVNHFDLGGPE